jgi:adenylate kinase family enzyme
LYILGGPGSGKGTQCERLVRDYKFEHISVGDVMRTEIKRFLKIISLIIY